MRVHVLGPGHPFRGGIARTTTELVRALVARGHDVTFFSAERQYPSWLYPGRSDRDPSACPELEQARPILDPLNPLSWHRVRRTITETPADAWIVPYWTWVWAPWWSYLLRARPLPPVLSVVHNPVDHDARFFARMAGSRVLARSGGLLAHAEAMADQLRAQWPGRMVGSHPLPPTPLPEVPGRDEVRRRLGLPDETRIALFLGLIRPYKGVDVLVEAFSGLPADSGWQLVIAGEPWGGIGESLRAQIDQLGVGDRIRLELGWASEERMAALLSAADVLVLPYLRATQSAVAPIALAAGVPVLCSTAGGLTEVIDSGVNGLAVPPNSVEALRNALEELDRGTVDRLAEGARASARRLSWDSYAREVERVLAEMIEG